MLRLIRYLKPYTLLILLAIVLLFIQANCDLSLPDYMSKIVDYGIQQGGVVNAIPVAIRQSEMNRLFLFMTAENKALVLGDYTLVDKNSPDYSSYVKDYPDLANEPVYVLKNIDKAETTQLNPVIGKAILVVYGIEQVMADPSKASTLAQGFNFDMSKVPAGTDIFALIAKMPSASLTQMTAAMDQKFAALGDSMISQSAAVAVKAEYTALGMDTGKLQTNYIVTHRHIDAAVVIAVCGLLSDRRLSVGQNGCRFSARFA